MQVIVPDLQPASFVPDSSASLPPRLLAAIAIEYASRGSLAAHDVPAAPGPGDRHFGRVFRRATHDIWIIRWGPGSRTEVHDHGGSAGALFVVAGTLVEHLPDPIGGYPVRGRELQTFEHRLMQPAHVHAIVNESDTTATSIHVYSPPLTTMQHFESANGSALRPARTEVIDATTVGPDGATPHD